MTKKLKTEISEMTESINFATKQRNFFHVADLTYKEKEFFDYVKKGNLFMVRNRIIDYPEFVNISDNYR